MLIFRILGRRLGRPVFLIMLVSLLLLIFRNNNGNYLEDYDNDTVSLNIRERSQIASRTAKISFRTFPSTSFPSIPRDQSSLLDPSVPIEFSYFYQDQIIGLGGCINNGLNALLLARSTGTDCRFYIHQSWSYVTLKEFFNSSLIVEPSTERCESGDRFSGFPRRFKDLQPYLATAQKQAKDGSVRIPLGPFMNAIWYPFRDLCGNYAEWSGKSASGQPLSYEYKAAVTQTEFWILQPKYRQLVDYLWQNHPLLSADRVLIAMHIRRGDKITAGEMQMISTDRYADQAKIMSGDAPVVTVFVMSDDSAAIDDLASHLKARGSDRQQFSLLTMRDLLGFVRDKGGCGERCYQPSDSEQSDGIASSAAAQREFITRDLVLSLEMTRLADYFICTFSSNIGRLAAVLRPDLRLDRIHSFDDGWYIL